MNRWEELTEGTLGQLYREAMERALALTLFEAAELEKECEREIVSNSGSRLKTPESIKRKLNRKGYECSLENAVKKLHDIAGVRVICFFLDDVYALADRLKDQPEFRFVKEKNYIKKPKSSGYKSLHLIVEVPVEYKGTEQWIQVEIQIRTLAMDFWARLDHRLCYKKERKTTRAVRENLKECAELISKVDSQMLRLRNRIDVLS